MNNYFKLFLIIITASIQLPELLNASARGVILQARARRQAALDKQNNINNVTLAPISAPTRLSLFQAETRNDASESRHGVLNPIQEAASASNMLTISKTFRRDGYTVLPAIERNESNTSNTQINPRAGADLSRWQYLFTEIRAARDWFLYGDLQAVFFPNHAARERAELLAYIAKTRKQINDSNAKMDEDFALKATTNNIRVDLNNNDDDIDNQKL